MSRQTFVLGELKDNEYFSEDVYHFKTQFCVVFCLFVIKGFVFKTVVVFCVASV